MSNLKDTQVMITIPLEEESAGDQKGTCFKAIEHHPLMEISQSTGHLLLLKLWQREEDLFGRKLALKETRMNTIKRELFQLCSFFFMFHGFILTILFTTSLNGKHHCSKWWMPSLLSVSYSSVLVFLVQFKLCGYWKVWRRLEREKSESRALTRCIQELRMKGASFDLSKEPQTGRRMKSSSVEIKWKPLTWCSHYLITICLVCFAGLLFPAYKFVLCA